MKKQLVLFLFINFLAHSLIAQDTTSTKDKDNDPKFSVGLITGSHTQRLRVNNKHLKNLTSYNLSFAIDYQVSDDFYFKTGFTQLSTVSIDGLSYKSHIIPIIAGVDLNFFNELFGFSHNSDFIILAEAGFYYKGISDFQNDTSFEYKTNNTYGVQTSLGLRYNLSELMFSIISFRINNERGDIIKRPDNNIKVENSYGFELGFGFRF